MSITHDREVSKIRSPHGATAGRVFASLLLAGLTAAVTGSRQSQSAFAAQPMHVARAHEVTPAKGPAKVSLRGLVSRFHRQDRIKATLARPAHAKQQMEAINRRVSDASALKIPQSSWPTNILNFTSAQFTPGLLDNANRNLFANGNLFHRQAYGTHGALGGYDENAQISFGHYDNYVYSEWLGSFYSTAQLANSRVDDAVNTLTAQGVRGQSCYLGNAPNCHLFIWASGLGQNNFAYLVYAVWSNDNAVGELAFLSGPRSFLPNQSTLGKNFHDLLAQGSAALVAAGATVNGGAADLSTPPPAPTITIDKVNVLHIVRGRYKSTRKLHVNETTSFLAYFHMSSVGTYDAAGHLTFFFPKSQIVMNKDGQSIYVGKPSLEVTPTGAFYFNHDGTFTDTSAEGKVTEHFTVMLGGAQDTKSVDLTVGQPLGTTLRR